MENPLLPKDVTTLIENHKSSELEGQLHSVFYREGSLRKILDIKGCQGIRFHIGKDNGKLHIIAEPADKNGNPVATPTDSTLRTVMPNETGGEYYSPDASCPNDCPPGGN